jgi:hypothetical protein
MEFLVLLAATVKFGVHRVIAVFVPRVQTGMVIPVSLVKPDMFGIVRQIVADVRPGRIGMALIV